MRGRGQARAAFALAAAALIAAGASCAGSAPEGRAARPIRELRAELEALASEYRSLAKVVVLGEGASAERPGGDPGEPMLALEIRAPEIAEGSAAGEACPAAEIVGAMHGDEQIGAELALGLAERLLAAYARGDGSAADAVASSVALTIVPVANPYGYESDSRLNASGIDLNRDFPWPFAYEPGYAGGRGFAAAPESKALARDARSKRYALAICLHSGDYRICLPWDYIGGASGGTRTYAAGEYVRTYSPADPFFEARGAAYAALVERATGAGAGSFPSVRGYDWYYAGGTYADWLYGELGCPAYSVELSPHKSWASRPAAEGFEVERAHEAALIDLLSSGLMGARGIVLAGSPRAGAAARVTALALAPSARALPEPIPYSAFGLAGPSGYFRITLPPGRWSLSAKGLDAQGNSTSSSSGPAVATVGPDGFSSAVTLILD